MRPPHFTDEDRQVRCEHLTQRQSHLPRARGSHRGLLTPHHVSALPCAALMERQGLGEQDKRGLELGLSVTWSHQGGEEQHPWSQGWEGGCVWAKGATQQHLMPPCPQPLQPPEADAWEDSWAQEAS